MQHRYAAITATAILLQASGPATQAQWQPVGPPAFSAGMVDYPVLAIGPDDAPCVAFSDWTNANKLTAMKYNGGSWQILGNAGFSAGTALDPAIGFNGAGVAYVAYRDMANGQKITVMKLNGTTWEMVGSAGVSAGSGAKPSMAFGPGDTPHVAYVDNANSGNLTVKKYEGGTWNALGAEGYSPIYAADVSLAFNSTGVPYVAYHGNSAGCRVERFENGAWELVGSLANLYNVQVAALCISGDDVPYIAYNDVGDDFHAKVKKMDNGDWALVGAASSGDEDPAQLCMAMDASGTIYVAYADMDLGIRATVKKFTDGSWQALGNQGFTEPATNSLSLALGQWGTPYIGFKDPANSTFRATVMRYEDGTSAVAAHGATADLLLVPNPAQDRVTITGLSTSAQISVWDLTGQQVLPTVMASVNSTLSTHALPAGLYVVKVQADGQSRSLRLVVEK
ncbi:MAG: T9SS type A sorting domain-containing protein [Flavobacteriales bacterium]|nr:T9SS type A sorting domain-containing protein [Flavobacteriales bacterium]MBP9080897.1 T9SS type A sorting domain-containing protein [Flavobacteriales bacterium]